MANDERDRAIALSLVRGYLTRLPLNGHAPPPPALSPLTRELLHALLSLTDDYETRYREQLTNLANTWAINAGAPRGSFVEVLDTIFADGCNWGRIVTIFIFVGMFLRKCSAQRMLVSPLEVTDWAVDYLVTKIAPWIHDNGDWMGLVKFYKEGDVAAQMQDEGRMFKRLLTLAGAAGLVVLGLTSLLSNRV